MWRSNLNMSWLLCIYSISLVGPSYFPIETGLGVTTPLWQSFHHSVRCQPPKHRVEMVYILAEMANASASAS